MFESLAFILPHFREPDLAVRLATTPQLGGVPHDGELPDILSLHLSPPRAGVARRGDSQTNVGASLASKERPKLRAIAR
jgi:hypothetical protein